MFIENLKSSFVKFLEYVTYGFFAIFPFFIFKNFLYQGSSSRFLLLTLIYAVLSICFGFYLFKKKSRVSFLKSPIIYILGIYIVYLFISAILGVDFYASFWSRAERTSGLFYIVHLIPFILFTSYLLAQKESREKLINVILLSSGLFSLLSLLGHQGFKLVFKNNPYDGFLFGNSSFAAMYLLGTFLLSIYFVFRKAKVKWFQYFIPLIFIFNPYFLNIKMFKGQATGFLDFMGTSKASTIALVLSVFSIMFFTLISKIKNIKFRNISIISAVIVGVLFLVWVSNSLLQEGGIVRKFYEGQSTAARLLVWNISKESIKQNPFTGWGIDNFYTAFQKNFDNRLLEERYGNEPWFDRAHNVILDQTVDTGYLGIVLYLLIYLVLISCLTYSLIKSENKEDRILSIILLTYFFAHLMELQTAFDTTISWTMFMFMVSFSIVLFDKIIKSQKINTEVELSNISKYILGSFFVGFFAWSLFGGIIPFWRVQNINGEIRKVGSSEKRIPLYEKLFKTKIDPLGVVWRSSTDFEKSISQNPAILEDPQKARGLYKELEIFAAEYKEYTEKYPNSIRAYFNLADMYIYSMLFGVDKLDEANQVLDKAIEIKPNYPQSYWMKSVVYLYKGDFKNAKFYVAEAERINPNAVETKRLRAYIEESIKTFPEIDLYFFNQI
ncbi:MAG TPA: O-antigen ligase family protein [Candidatus Paceibacterota bacterium]|nr:O-antigen ligase family protein [Candidatus Paceibacterota bacterium]